MMGFNWLPFYSGYLFSISLSSSLKHDFKLKERPFLFWIWLDLLLLPCDTVPLLLLMTLILGLMTSFDLSPDPLYSAIELFSLFNELFEIFDRLFWLSRSWILRRCVGLSDFLSESVFLNEMFIALSWLSLFRLLGLYPTTKENSDWSPI